MHWGLGPIPESEAFWGLRCAVHWGLGPIPESEAFWGLRCAAERPALQKADRRG